MNTKDSIQVIKKNNEMEIEVTVQDLDQEYYVGKPRIVDYVKLQSQDIKMIIQFVRSIGNGEWLDISTHQTTNEMNNCTKNLIKQTEAELISAKKYMKDNFPVRYKLSFLKIIIKNPIKTLIAKCLLK